MNPNPPMTEAELHALVDGQLTPERQREIEAYLASCPDEAQRTDTYRAQRRALRALFDPVLTRRCRSACSTRHGRACPGICSESRLAWPLH